MHFALQENSSLSCRGGCRPPQFEEVTQQVKVLVDAVLAMGLAKGRKGVVW